MKNIVVALKKDHSFRQLKRLFLLPYLFFFFLFAFTAQGQDFRKGIGPLSNGPHFGMGFGLFSQGQLPSWIKPGLVVYYRSEGGNRGGGSASYLVMSTAYVVCAVEPNRVLGIEVQASKMGVSLIPKVLGKRGDGLFWVDPQRMAAMLSPQSIEQARRQGIAISGQPGLVIFEYAPRGKGVTKQVIKYDVRSGLVLDFETVSWSGVETAGSTVTKVSFLQKGSVQLPSLPSLPAAARMSALYQLQTVEQYTGMAVPTGRIQVQPMGNDGELARFNITTMDNSSAPLNSKEAWGLRFMGPHYYHPVLLHGYTLSLPGIGVTMVAKGNQVSVSWNGVIWGVATVDPRTGLVFSFQNKIFGGMTTGTLVH
ncbi:hypothetical protein [Nitratiruptor tergarcus]|uniref:Uncharacterized protein n=1 Tax=Nitratiruptor tergarcus DSM 16512 TaxID=1069081 RepID=A0A1W1WSW5_9BACT|nr:hypothetical protein [Nitratiruptor tergarcus]SMC08813.1 hypothetical protein SAMN05660197_0587 [Nitratiruptor tergarcus DSM 16512]